MPIDLYHMTASGPCRTVRLVAAAIGVNLNLIEVDLLNGEHLKPEFLKMNPQHTVPTFNDNGFILCESRAIVTYLIEKYAKNDDLYPKDPQKRALVNQRLFFDAGTLYQSLVDHYWPIIFTGAPSDPAKMEKINMAFQYLDKFLEGENYVAGSKMTVADIVLASTASNCSVFKYDIHQYKNVSKWFNKVTSELPKYKEINVEGLESYKQFIAKVAKKYNITNSLLQ